MNGFTEFCESKILELSEEAKNLEKNYRQDDAVFVKIKINVYDVCKTVFGVFMKTKPQESFAAEYLKKLDEFREIWSDSKEKAEKFLDSTSQTKKIFEEGEEFLSEETLFHYYYPLETLVYSYQLYFLYGPEGGQVINNDWGYECIVE